jgi:hypothetical protein
MDSSYSGSSEFYERYRHMSSRVESFLCIFTDSGVRFGKLFVEVMTRGTLWESSTILLQDAGNLLRLFHRVLEDVL